MVITDLNTVAIFCVIEAILIKSCITDFQIKNSPVMNSATVRRLKRELNDITRDPPSLCSASLINNDLYKWIATIDGPLGSPYEGGIFKLEMCFQDGYPFKPPTVRFLTKIYHCNVSERGVLCLDTLTVNWSPALTVSTILISICSLLTDCNPYHPMNRVIAHLYLSNRELHDSNARYYTKKYAVP